MVMVFFIVFVMPRTRHRYSYSTKTRIVPIRFSISKTADASLWEGEEKIVKKGKNGIKKVFLYYKSTYTPRYLSDPKVEKRMIHPKDKPAESIIRKPVMQIIRYGTKRGYPTNRPWEIKDHLFEKTEFAYADQGGYDLHTSDYNLTIEVSMVKLIKTKGRNILLVSYRLQNKFGKWKEEHKGEVWGNDPIKLEEDLALYPLSGLRLGLTEKTEKMGRQVVLDMLPNFFVLKDSQITTISLDLIRNNAVAPGSSKEITLGYTIDDPKTNVDHYVIIYDPRIGITRIGRHEKELDYFWTGTATQ